MTYRFAIYNEEGNEIKRYMFANYEDARIWVDEQLEKFKKVNRVRDETKDNAFKRYKKEFEEILSNPTKDVSENIAIAKEMRARGESPLIERFN